MNPRLSLPLAAALLLAPSLTWADTATLTTSRDNTLYENATGSLSNGAGPGMFAGTNSAGGIRRALIAFDIAGAIPAGSTIQSAKLTLTLTVTVSGPHPVGLNRVLAPWGEGASDAGAAGGGGGAPATPGDATWVHRFYDTTLWNTPGGDFGAQVATATVDAIGPYTWGSTADMVADVQAWLDHPESNFGWMVIGNELPPAPTAKRFGTRESLTAGERPMLEIQFEPPLTPVRADTWGRIKAMYRPPARR